MTIESDWADEEANKLLYYFRRDDKSLSDDTAFSKAMITALRAAFLRGRVTGLREAAEIVHANNGRFRRSIAATIRAAADKLESGS